MNSHQFRSSLHSYCDLYGAQVLEALGSAEEAEVLEGRMELSTRQEPYAFVRYAVTPEEAGAQLEAGKRGLKLYRRDGFDHLVPA